MIEPTVGRVVWIRGRTNKSDQPEAALVTYVWNSRLVNVGGFDKNGDPFKVTSLYLDQGDRPRPEVCQVWAEWMPYQKGQAAKTEALEKQIAGN